MRIKWYGHACFHLTGAGVRIVTDPYTPHASGLAPISEAADIVIMSTPDDRFHSCAAQVPGRPQVLQALSIARAGGSQVAHGLRFDAIEAQENVRYKAHPGSNAMYAVTIDGVRVAHMGDIGNPLTPAQIDFLRGTDVLFALTGGPVTIELDDLDTVLAAVRPRIVMPMHYRIPNLRLFALPLDAFTRRHPRESVVQSADTAIDVTPATLPPSMRIVALQPAANQVLHDCGLAARPAIA